MQKGSIASIGVVVAAMLALCAPILAQDPEPNDSLSQAYNLTLPHFDLRGAISTPQDVDFYKFKATKGQEITAWVRTASEGSGLAATLAFYDNSGRLLAYNDKQWSLYSRSVVAEPILYLKIPSTGTWYLAVSAKSKSIGQIWYPVASETGPYQLVLASGMFDTPAVADPFEPNDSVSAAKSVSVPLETTANLLYFGDIDWYQFPAKRADKIVVDVDALEKTTGWPDFSVKTRVGVFDRFGSLLQENDGAADPDSGFSGDPALVFQAPYDGNFYVAVTLVSDSRYSTGFSDSAFLQDPYVSSARHDVGYYRLNLHALNELVFPQIANGAFGDLYFTTSLLLVNYSAAAATGKVEFFDAEGAPMVSASEPGGAPSNSVFFSIPPKGSRVIKTDGQGPGASGYAVMQSSVPIGASAVFSQHRTDGTLMTEAGVVAARPMEFFTFPVDVTGDFNTGVAVANTDQDRDINLYLKLMDTNGQQVQPRTVTLQAGHQISIFVSGLGQLFPNVTNFRGSLQVFADAPVPAVALRSSSHTLSTLPAASLTQAQGSVVLYFPHVVNGTAGSSYRSTIILTNPGYFRVYGSLTFMRFDGSPMPATGSLQSVLSFNIPAQGTRFIDLPPSSDDLQRGYAVLTADHTLSGVIIFSQYETSTGRLQTEVAVEAAAPHQKFCLFAEQEDGYNTGIAVANVNQVATELGYRLDFGHDTVLEKGPVTLGARRQTADLVAGSAQIFPEFLGQGILEVSSSEPVPAVALRISETTMTALPVIPVP